MIRKILIGFVLLCMVSDLLLFTVYSETYTNISYEITNPIKGLLVSLAMLQISIFQLISLGLLGVVVWFIIKKFIIGR